MQEITALEQRITAALDRIGKGIDGIGAAAVVIAHLLSVFLGSLGI